MKKIILLGLIILSITAKSQVSFSDGACKAGFRFEINYEVMTLVPSTVLNFYDTSEGDVKEWYWDFGDGSGYINEQNPVHIFTHPLGGPEVKMSPYRTVTLTIVTDSCKSSFSQTINILDLNDSVQIQHCMASFYYKEAGRDSDGNVLFSFINNSMGENLSWLWQFGNDTESTDKEPVIAFNMNQPVNKVCLTVYGPDSCSAMYCSDVYVTPEWPGDSVYTDTTYTDTTWQNCNVSFSTSPLRSCPGWRSR